MKLSANYYLFRESATSGLLINHEDGKVFALNATSMAVLDALEVSDSQDEIIDAALARFSNIPTSASVELKVFLQSMLKAGIVIENIQKSLILVLPIADGENAVIQANDTDGEKFLQQLAGILKLSCRYRVANDLEAVVTIGGMPEPDMVEWPGCWRYAGKIYWQPEQLRWHFAVTYGEALSNLSRGAMRRILDLALMPSIMQKNSVLMHGALLQLPESGKGAILFAESGVGKSTSSGRFADQGGQVCSDDKILVTFLPDGTVKAQPLPTWSAFLNSDISVDFGNAVKVKGIFRLLRGENDQIVADNGDQWKIWLASSLNTFLQYPLNWMPWTFHKKILNKELKFISDFEQKFGRHAILGDLNGQIFDSINNFIL